MDWAGAMRITHSFTRLLKDRGGNFGMMTAILAPLALGSAGIAIDMTRAFQTKTEMQSLADSAALAAASSLSEKGISTAEAIERAKNLYAAQMVNFMKTGKESDAEIAAMVAAQKAALTVNITETANGSKGKAYSVTVSSSFQLPVNAMTKLVAGSTMGLGSTSTATSASESTNGISMYLALDRSGSMSFKTSTVVKNATCVNYTATNWGNKNITNTRDSRYIWPEKPCYVRKIDALKTAASSMFTALNKADINNTLVRVGASAYTHENFAVSPIAWGTSNAAKYVAAIPSLPEGGTDANSSMTAAINALKSSGATENGRSKLTEQQIQDEKGNATVSRYIVLMTDGEMTGNSSSFNRSLDNSVRDKCDAAKKDGIQIFTVAFMAPDTGKSLLNYCASDASYYYEPDDMETLVTAFGEIAEKAAKATTRLTN